MFAKPLYWPQEVDDATARDKIEMTVDADGSASIASSFTKHTSGILRLPLCPQWTFLARSSYLARMDILRCGSFLNFSSRVIRFGRPYVLLARANIPKKSSSSMEISLRSSSSKTSLRLALCCHSDIQIQSDVDLIFLLITYRREHLMRPFET